MHDRLLRVGALIIIAGLLVTGCQKKAPEAVVPPAPKPETIELVKSAERSAHFQTVAKHLELGGTLYGYMDVDGDAMKVADSLQQTWTQVAAQQPQLQPYAKQDFGAIVTKLGFDNIRAVGFSSVPDGTGFFRNRVFLYLPGERHGLLAGLGGAPAPFQRLNWAPADTDLYSESEIDLPELYNTLYAIVDQVGGAEASGKFEDGLTKAGRNAAFSLLEVIQHWKGRMVLISRFNGDKTLALPAPQPVQIPDFSLLLAVDGVAPALRDALDKMPLLKVSEEAGRRVYRMARPLPINGLNPVIAIDGSTLLLATTPEYLDECLKGQGGLATTPAFQTALAHVGSEGNALTYCTPRFFTRLRDVPKLNPNLPAESGNLIKLIFASLPQPDRPLVSVRSNLADGILIDTYANASLKKDLVMLSVYNPASVGLVAAMAIPAFQKVRAASQEKAVLNNLRQLAAAADQYYLEHGVETATYDDLVGEGPDKYIRRIQPVAGENYRHVTFQQGKPLRVRVPALRKVVEYQP